MYWWNASKLAEDLREGRVDEEERFKYFLATFIVWNIVVLMVCFSGAPFSIDVLLSAAVSLITAVFGVILCYRANKSGDNTDFIGRMICLGLPVGAQNAAAWMAAFLVMVAFFCLHAAIFNSEPISEIADMFRKAWIWSYESPYLRVCFLLNYYLWIRRRIAIVAQGKGAQGDARIMTSNLSDGEIILGLFGGLGALIIQMLGLLYVPSLVGLRSLGELLSLLAAGSWLLLFFFIFSWLRRRSTKHT